jgi:hypothetical protein
MVVLVGVCSPVFFSVECSLHLCLAGPGAYDVGGGDRGPQYSMGMRGSSGSSAGDTPGLFVFSLTLFLLFLRFVSLFVFSEGWRAIAPVSKSKCTGPGAYDVPSGDRGPQHSLASRHETPKKASETPGVPCFVLAELCCAVLCCAVLRPAFFFSGNWWRSCLFWGVPSQLSFLELKEREPSWVSLLGHRGYRSGGDGTGWNEMGRNQNRGIGFSFHF